MPSATEAKRLLLQHMPPGVSRWMALDRAGAGVSGMWDAIAQSAKTYGFDVLDQLRRELKAWQMVDRLADWEAMMGLSTGRVATYGTTDMRRAQIVARRRERGLPVEARVLASFEALCGGTTGVEVLQHGRNELTAENWYDVSGGILPLAIAAAADTELTFVAADNAPASSMGAQARVKVTHPSIEDLQLRIYAPDGDDSGVKTFGSGAVTDQIFVFAWPGAAGKDIDGTWRVVITDNGGAGGTLEDPAGDGIVGLFVEGIGRSAGAWPPGAAPEGHGANVYAWAVLIDESAMPASRYDRQAARDLVRRWNPAHTRGYLCLYASTGDRSGVFDDPKSMFDGCIFAE